jgi:hypothetical protein
MPVLTPVPMNAIAVVRISLTTDTKVYDYHVFPATELGKQQCEAMIAETNSLYHKVLLRLMGSRYALYCVNPRDVNAMTLHSPRICCLHVQDCATRRQHSCLSHSHLTSERRWSGRLPIPVQHLP